MNSCSKFFWELMPLIIFAKSSTVILLFAAFGLCNDVCIIIVAYDSKKTHSADISPYIFSLPLGLSWTNFSPKISITLSTI